MHEVCMQVNGVEDRVTCCTCLDIHAATVNLMCLSLMYYLCVCVRACVCVCVRACVRACVHVCIIKIIKA